MQTTTIQNDPLIGAVAASAPLTTTTAANAPTAPALNLSHGAPLANGRLTLISRVADEIAQNRPGIQTTEFLVVSVLLTADVVLTAAGKVPPSCTVIFGAFSAAAYQWLRNNRKDERESSLLTLVETLMHGLGRETENGGMGDTGGASVSQVAGLQNAVPASASSSNNGHASLSLLCVLCLFAATFLTSCAALARFQADPRVQFAEQEALKIGEAALQRYSNGGNFDSVWGISEGLYALTDTVSAITAKNPTDPNGALAVQLAQTIQGYASTGDTKKLAGQIAAIITKANPQTDQQRVEMVNAIANSLQGAATVAKPTDGKTVAPAQANRAKGKAEIQGTPRVPASPAPHFAIALED